MRADGRGLRYCGVTGCEFTLPRKINSHSFIMPMSMQRLRRQAWQWRRLSLVMVQLPLNGQVKEALRFMLRLRGWGEGGNVS